MSAARLTSAMQVSALLRRASDSGGAAVVVARGDANAGAILIIGRERGNFTGFLEHVLTPSGDYAWTAVGPGDDSSPESVAWIDRRRARDPDLWIIELDIAEPQRFAAETMA